MPELVLQWLETPTGGSGFDRCFPLAGGIYCVLILKQFLSGSLPGK